MRNKLQVIVLVVALLLAGFGAFRPAKKEVTHEVKTETSQQFGAITGPELPFPYLQINNLRLWPFNAPVYAASTTACAIQSPSSTSTLVSFALNFRNSTTTSAVVTVAKGSSPGATTTQLIPDTTVSGNARATITATSSNAGSDVNNLYGPNTYLNVTLKGGAGGFTPAGQCTGIFEETGTSI